MFIHKKTKTKIIIIKNWNKPTFPSAWMPHSLLPLIMLIKDEAKRRLKVGGGSSERDEIIGWDKQMHILFLLFHEEKLIVCMIIWSLLFYIISKNQQLFLAERKTETRQVCLKLYVNEGDDQRRERSHIESNTFKRGLAISRKPTPKEKKIMEFWGW